MGEMQKKLDRIQIVLVEPQDSANVGSVCRAMKTMGISRLCITGRKRGYFHLDRVYAPAVHAKELFDNARYCTTLEEALADSVLSAGVTRRRGKYRKYFSYLPEQFVEKADTIAEGTVSMVFGRESSGLRDDELQLCSTAVHIPSSPRFPSLNLAQAVQVCTYACYRGFGDALGSYTPIERKRVQELSDCVVSSLDDFDFFKQQEREDVRRLLTDVFTRASLSQSESVKIEKIFKRINAFVIHRPPSLR